MTPQEWDALVEERSDLLYVSGSTWFDAEVAAAVQIETEHGLRPKEAA